MRLPIDQTGFTFTTIGSPKRIGDKEAHLEIAAIRDGQLAKLRVTIPREARITAGQKVEIDGLSVSTTVLYADAVRVVEAPTPPPPDQPGP